MYQGKKVLAVIPVRCGSKTIKNLNIYPIYKKPLFLITCEEAKKSKYIDTICVSTDSMKYALVAEQNGFIVPFIRPNNLATDESRLIEAVVHARDYYKRKNNSYDCIVTLMANAPLKTVEDIDNAIVKYFESGEQNVVSITDCNVIPHLIRTVEGDKLTKIINVSSTYAKELLPTYYQVCESIYVNSFSNINLNTSLNDNNISFYIPKERSIVIKNLEDIRIVRSVVKSQKVSEYFKNK